MPEIKFSKHSLELIVRTEDYPGILENAFEIATVTISNVVFVGEISSVSAKKIKDKDSGEIEVWANVRLSVSTIGTSCETALYHPSKNYEIEDDVTISYGTHVPETGNLSSIGKTSEKEHFIFE